MSTGVSLHFVARCGEEAAIAAVVERNATTICIILASLLARRKVSFFGPRQVELALVHVAFLSDFPTQFFHYRRVRTGAGPCVLAL